MVVITFPDRETEKRALGFLFGRFSGKVLKTGEHLVPEAALEALASQDISFVVKGKAADEQQAAAGITEPLANSLPFDSANLPLRLDDGGVVRVGSSRVSFDLVVEQYENGMTPEEMVRAYDTLLLADVYAAIAYYLHHLDAVQGYLKRRRDEAAALRASIEADRPPITREELTTRRSAGEKDHAATMH